MPSSGDSCQLVSKITNNFFFSVLLLHKFSFSGSALKLGPQKGIESKVKRTWKENEATKN